MSTLQASLIMLASFVSLSTALHMGSKPHLTVENKESAASVLKTKDKTESLKLSPQDACLGGDWWIGQGSSWGVINSDIPKDEKLLGMLSPELGNESRDACIAWVKNEYPEANGATVKVGGSGKIAYYWNSNGEQEHDWEKTQYFGCYANFHATDIKDPIDNSWLFCPFNEGPNTFCEHLPPKVIKGPTSRQNNMWNSGEPLCGGWGDPHFLHTFDRGHEHTDNGAGVAVMAKTKNGLFEVQSFFCPVSDEATVMSAYAIKTGDDVVQMIGNTTYLNGEMMSNPSGNFDFKTIMNYGHKARCLSSTIGGSEEIRAWFYAQWLAVDGYPFDGEFEMNMELREEELDPSKGICNRWETGNFIPCSSSLFTEAQIELLGTSCGFKMPECEPPDSFNPVSDPPTACVHAGIDISIAQDACSVVAPEFQKDCVLDFCESGCNWQVIDDIPKTPSPPTPDVIDPNAFEWKTTDVEYYCFGKYFDRWADGEKVPPPEKNPDMNTSEQCMQECANHMECSGFTFQQWSGYNTCIWQKGPIEIRKGGNYQSCYEKRWDWHSISSNEDSSTNPAPKPELNCTRPPTFLPTPAPTPAPTEGGDVPQCTNCGSRPMECWEACGGTKGYCLACDSLNGRRGACCYAGGPDDPAPGSPGEGTDDYDPPECQTVDQDQFLYTGYHMCVLTKPEPPPAPPSRLIRNHGFSA